MDMQCLEELAPKLIQGIHLKEERVDINQEAILQLLVDPKRIGLITKRKLVAGWSSRHGGVQSCRSLIDSLNHLRHEVESRGDVYAEFFQPLCQFLRAAA